MTIDSPPRGVVRHAQFWFLAIAACEIAAAVQAQTPDRGIAPLSPELRERCLQTCRTVLASDEFWPAMHAAEALTLAGEGEEVAAAFAPRVERETDHQRRCGLARELVRTGRRLPLTELWDILADEESDGRVHAAESLYKVAEVGDGRLLRDALAQTANPRLRLMAAAALGRAGNLAALDVLRTQLDSDDRELRKVAAWVLGLLGTSDDVAAIKNMLAVETDSLARAYAINALACLGDEAARKTLGENLSSEDPAIRTYSAEFAGYARCLELRPRLIELLDDPIGDVRVRAAQSLVMFSLTPPVVGLPQVAAFEDLSVDVFPATAEHPRYSEGSLIALRDGSLLYATTEFAGGGADHATASIVGRVSRDGGSTWEEARTLQENVGRQNVMSVTLRRLSVGRSLRERQNNNSRSELTTLSLGMFFLIKNGPSDLKVYLRISDDEGQSWGDPIVVTPGAGYHVMNNDRVTRLTTGRLICPVAWTDDVFQGGHFVCVCFLSDDGGRTWRESADRVNQPRRGAMEPDVVELADGRLLMIIRTQLGHIATSVSEDGGEHWAPPGKLPLNAPEAPATIRAIPATGDLLLIWNNTYQPGAGHGGPRTPLTAAISSDAGQTWRHVRNLETNPNEAYAYTSILFHKDRVLLSYYVDDKDTHRISSRFRSLPVRWFYEAP